MGLFNKSNSNHDKKGNGEKKDEGNQVNRKTTKYVYLSSRKAVFLITGEPKESKYAYSVPIIPLNGLYYSSKDKRRYAAKELATYYIILNIDKEDADALRGKKIVLTGYNENEILFVPNNEGDNNGDSQA